VSEFGDFNETVFYVVRFKVLTAVSMKVIAFWDIAPCSLITLMMESVCTSETVVCSKETTQCYIPEGYLHTCHRENLKYHFEEISLP
jgi:hypothetical protein